MLPILSYSFQRYINTKIYSSWLGDSLKFGSQSFGLHPTCTLWRPKELNLKTFKHQGTAKFMRVKSSYNSKSHLEKISVHKLLEAGSPCGNHVTLWVCPGNGSPWQWPWPPPSWLRPPSNLPVTGSSTCGCRWLWNSSPAAAWGPGGKPQR